MGEDSHGISPLGKDLTGVRHLHLAALPAIASLAPDRDNRQASAAALAAAAANGLRKDAIGSGLACGELGAVAHIHGAAVAACRLEAS